MRDGTGASGGADDGVWRKKVFLVNTVVRLEAAGEQPAISLLKCLQVVPCACSAQWDTHIFHAWTWHTTPASGSTHGGLSLHATVQILEACTASAGQHARKSCIAMVG